MRAICFADVHGDLGAVVKLKNSILAEEFDYVFILGDFSRGFKDPDENREDIERVLDALREFSVKAIPGNCDQRASVKALMERDASLHNTVLNLPDASIIGLGGSNVTPFGTPFEYAEKEISDALANMYERVDDRQRLIVMSHTPPKDTKCDIIAGGIHVGSQALRQFIESRKPQLVLCSHIHEAGGAQDNIGPTRVYNLGRLTEGRAYVLTAEDEITVEPYLG
jgi:uncharacterized protein